jgi:hypothetical protein
MIRSMAVFVVVLSLVISGCSPDKKEEPGSSASLLGQITPLSQADKEKILAFKKELFDIEKVSQKALTLVGNEVKLMAKGEKSSFDAADLADKAKVESENALDAFAKKKLPENLSAWVNQNLKEVKEGYSASYKAKIESLAAVKKFLDEKNPLALLEYKKKASEAEKLLKGSTEKLVMVLSQAGQSDKNAPASGKTVKE